MSSFQTLGVNFDVKGHPLVKQAFAELTGAMNNFVTTTTQVSTKVAQSVTPLGNLSGKLNEIAGINLGPMANSVNQAVDSSKELGGQSFEKPVSGLGRMKTSFGSIGTSILNASASLGVFAAGIFGIDNAFDNLERAEFRVNTQRIRAQSLQVQIARGEQQLSDMRKDSKYTTEELSTKEDQLQVLRERLATTIQKVAFEQQNLNDTQNEFKSQILPQIIAVGGSGVTMFTSMADIVTKNKTHFMDLKDTVGRFISSFSSVSPEITKNQNALGFLNRELANNTRGFGLVKSTLGGMIGAIGPVGIAMIGLGAAVGILGTNAFGVTDRLNELGGSVGRTIPQLRGFLDVVGGAGDALRKMFDPNFKTASEIHTATINKIKTSTETLDEAIARLQVNASIELKRMNEDWLNFSELLVGKDLKGKLDVLGSAIAEALDVKNTDSFFERMVLLRDSGLNLVGTLKTLGPEAGPSIKLINDIVSEMNVLLEDGVITTEDWDRIFRDFGAENAFKLVLMRMLELYNAQNAVNDLQKQVNTTFSQLVLTELRANVEGDKMFNVFKEGLKSNGVELRNGKDYIDSFVESVSKGDKVFAQFLKTELTKRLTSEIKLLNVEVEKTVGVMLNAKTGTDEFGTTYDELTDRRKTAKMVTDEESKALDTQLNSLRSLGVQHGLSVLQIENVIAAENGDINVKKQNVLAVQELILKYGTYMTFLADAALMQSKVNQATIEGKLAVNDLVQTTVLAEAKSKGFKQALLEQADVLTRTLPGGIREYTSLLVNEFLPRTKAAIDSIKQQFNDFDTKEGRAKFREFLDSLSFEGNLEKDIKVAFKKDAKFDSAVDELKKEMEVLSAFVISPEFKTDKQAEQTIKTIQSDLDKISKLHPELSLVYGSVDALLNSIKNSQDPVTTLKNNWEQIMKVTDTSNIDDVTLSFNLLYDQLSKTNSEMAKFLKTDLNQKKFGTIMDQEDTFKKIDELRERGGKKNLAKADKLEKELKDKSKTGVLDINIGGGTGGGVQLPTVTDADKKSIDDTFAKINELKAAIASIGTTKIPAPDASLISQLINDLTTAIKLFGSNIIKLSKGVISPPDTKQYGTALVILTKATSLFGQSIIKNSKGTIAAPDASLIAQLINDLTTALKQFGKNVITYTKSTIATPDATAAINKINDFTNKLKAIPTSVTVKVKVSVDSSELKKIPGQQYGGVSILDKDTFIRGGEGNRPEAHIMIPLDPHQAAHSDYKIKLPGLIRDSPHEQSSIASRFGNMMSKGGSVISSFQSRLGNIVLYPILNATINVSLDGAIIHKQKINVPISPYSELFKR